MRKFFSYGPLDVNLHYYAPRTALIERACQQLIGDDPTAGGHYITVWAPRQSGKSWLLLQTVSAIKQRGDFDVAITTLQSGKNAQTPAAVLKILVTNLRNHFQQDFPKISAWSDLRTLFTAAYFDKPVILILDEFDALEPAFINALANEFRSIYTERINETERISAEKSYLLHGLALIGVRNVLGIENVSGSPFNVQRSLRIPNLTLEEVTGMFQWYAQESGQAVEQAVIDRIFYETQGQPGLIGWLGELVTETYNHHGETITLADFEQAYTAAVRLLPNNNVLNIISKAKQEPFKQVVLDLFQTQTKIEFSFEEPNLNYLYLNGVIDYEQVGDNYFAKFPSPLIQKRLFHYFARDIFPRLGQLFDPFADLQDTITPTTLHLPRLLQRYESYLQQHAPRLFKDAPRRADDFRVYEAVYHFNLYMYLMRFLESYSAQVHPEFPTGNGKIDLLIRYAGQRYGMEVKSFASRREYEKALVQAADYARQLGLTVILLVMFIDAVDEDNRRKFEAPYVDAATGVTVNPQFVVTGTP
ncbi:MAG: AAA-like domain-containing protein [Caldilineaceae bacterium]